MLHYSVQWLGFYSHTKTIETNKNFQNCSVKRSRKKVLAMSNSKLENAVSMKIRRSESGYFVIF